MFVVLMVDIASSSDIGNQCTRIVIGESPIDTVYDAQSVCLNSKKSKRRRTKKTKKASSVTAAEDQDWRLHTWIGPFKTQKLAQSALAAWKAQKSGTRAQIGAGVTLALQYGVKCYSLNPAQTTEMHRKFNSAQSPAGASALGLVPASSHK